MKRWPITSRGLFTGTVVLLGIPAVLLLAIMSLLILLMFGGGWAYSGAGSCRCEMNQFGIVMVSVVTLGLFTFLYAIGRLLARRYQNRKTPIEE